MSLYRKVEQQTWGDKKFQALSPLPPCGQALWLYLLTGPQTSILPGLLRAGRAAMAEELGWSVEGFDEAFAEPFREGMVKADWKARLVWLPKALRDTNKPDNPNVARAWGKAFDLLPECDLKAEAGDAICLFLVGLGPAYLAAFTGDSAADTGVGQVSGTPSPKPSGNPSGKGSPKGMAKGSQKGVPKQETGNRILKDTHTAREREASPTGRVVPFDTPPEAPPRHCAYHSTKGLSVPHGLHAEFVEKLVHARGVSVDVANEVLFEWYRQTETAWTARGVVGDDDYAFWRARWREQHGTTVPADPPKVAGLAGGGVTPRAPQHEWSCAHGEPDKCRNKKDCTMRTVHDVREGRMALEDVQPALAAAVRDWLQYYNPVPSSQAVHA